MLPSSRPTPPISTLDLVEKSGVLCTPGSSFGPLGEGYVRFALTLPPERIAEAVQSIKASGILN